MKPVAFVMVVDRHGDERAFNLDHVAGIRRHKRVIGLDYDEDPPVLIQGDAENYVVIEFTNDSDPVELEVRDSDGKPVESPVVAVMNELMTMADRRALALQRKITEQSIAMQSRLAQSAAASRIANALKTSN